MFRSILLALAATASITAFATPDLGACRLNFHVDIKSTFFWQTGNGTGMLTCSDSTGETPFTREVTIDISGYGIGLGQFSYDGVSGNIGILEPSQIEGTYWVADANIAIGKGFGLSLDFFNQANGLSFGGKVKGGSGLGVALNGSLWQIRLAH